MNRPFREEACARKKAGLILKNCRLVNVLSGEIENGADIAICGSQIVGIGPGYEAEQTIDVASRYVYPGFIDAHIHLESTKLTVPEAARMMAKCGTAAVITDPHEIGNVAGLNGVAYQMDSAADNGFIDVFFVLPSCVPTLADASIETAPSTLDAQKLRMAAQHSTVVGLGELMNVPGILFGDPEVLQKLDDFRSLGLVLDGHAPMLGGPALNACIYMGIQSDHESTALAEAREKLRRGMHIMIREGSSEKNLDSLLPLINSHNTTRLMFASDDLDPTDLEARGHINHLVRRAVASGIDPITAIQMATLSPATYFNLRNLGAIAPGFDASLVIAPDLVSFNPDMVLHSGSIVFENGRLAQRPARKPHLPPTMNCRIPARDALRIPATANADIRIIELVPGQILTRETHEPACIQDGQAIADPARDIAKACVLERHHGTGAFALGFVRGFGLKRGAIGSSVGHDSHNLVIVGTNDEDMRACAELICGMGGGQAAVLGNDSASLPLPVAGLMSDAPARDVIDAEKALDAFCAQRLGITHPRPMAALCFMSLPVIPELRLTDQGLFHIAPGGYPQKVPVLVG
ncbi:MAG: adenine deaminase [Proteobacteria bacterium]|nr:adenine deaminase [Pseudomonadota bacterium]